MELTPVHNQKCIITENLVFHKGNLFCCMGLFIFVGLGLFHVPLSLSENKKVKESHREVRLFHFL